MEKKEILARIDEIKKEIEADSCSLIREKIRQGELNFQRSWRGFLMAPLINGLRRRFLVEINHVLAPLLENQKEIHLRLLKEIEKLKESHDALPQDHSRPLAPENKKTAGRT